MRLRIDEEFSVIGFSGLQGFIPGNGADAQQEVSALIGNLHGAAAILRDAAHQRTDPGGGNQEYGALPRCVDAGGIGNEEGQVFRFLSAVLAHGIHGPYADLFRAVHGGIEIRCGMRGVDQLFAKQLFRCDPGGRGKAVIRAGTVGEQEIRQGRYGIENRQGRCSLPGRDDVALIGAEVQHRVVLHHVGDIDQLIQPGVQVFLRLAQQAGIAFGYFLAEAVNQEGIGHAEKKRDRQDEHERI